MVLLAAMGMIVPPTAWAADPPAAASASTNDAATEPAARGPADVRLHDGGVLFGQVASVAGKPSPETEVTLRSADQEVGRVQTDKNGYFAFSSVHGGLYEVVVDKTAATYRVWEPQRAPPSALPGVLMVPDSQAIAGQSGPLAHWLKNPWVITALIGAAAVIPIAIHNNRSHRSASD